MPGVEQWLAAQRKGEISQSEQAGVERVVIIGLGLGAMRSVLGCCAYCCIGNPNLSCAKEMSPAAADVNVQQRDGGFEAGPAQRVEPGRLNPRR